MVALAVRTDRELVAECNELARIFYANRGFKVRRGYRFDQAGHPEELAMWRLACLAYDHIEGTDPDEAANNLEDNK